MTYAADQPGDEVRLGRNTLTTIGRHLDAMYEDVVTGEMPACLADALQRLRAHDDPVPDGGSIDRDE
jgi:hypothetical protein